MTKLKVLFANTPGHSYVPHDIPEFTEFSELFDIVEWPLESAEQFKKALQNELSDISAIFMTKVFFHPGLFNSFIDYLPETLKIISLRGVGSDRFDIEKLKSKGIIVTNIGDASAHDVADVALSLALCTFRFMHFWDRTTRDAGGDNMKAKSYMGGEGCDPKTGYPLEAPLERRQIPKFATIGGKNMDSPRGKVAAMVGFGSIGTQIAFRLWAIGMKIIYTKRSPLTDEQLAKLPFKPEFFSTVDEMLPKADLLMLAVPHTPQTVNIISEDSIRLCKKGIRIVNIGRGTAIDEDVLFKALDDGTVNSVGLDVFRNEPHIDKRYLNRYDVALAPHVGPFTRDNHRYVAVRVMDNIKNVLLENGGGIDAI